MRGDFPHLEEEKSIKKLQENPNIMKPVDKGSKIVIMDKQQYNMEDNRQLANPKYYKPIQESIQTQTLSQIRSIIQNFYNRKFINAKQRNFLFSPDDCLAAASCSHSSLSVSV